MSRSSSGSSGLAQCQALSKYWWNWIESEIESGHLTLIQCPDAIPKQRPA